MAISGLHLIAILTLLVGVAVYFSMHKRVKTISREVNRSEDELVIPVRYQYAYDHAMNPEDFQDPTFYTLTQCVHCDRLEKFLELNRIPFTKVLLDNYEGLARRKLIQKLRTYNPRGSFPTLVSPDGDVTVGFREAQVKDYFLKYQQDEKDQ